MIACHPKHLAARCRERGYTLDEVRPCIVSEDGESITVDETHPAYPRAAKAGFVPAKRLPPPDLTRTDAPSFLTKVRNFGASAAKHVAAGMPQASEDEVARRFAICETCEHFDGKACRLCGCPVVRQKQFLSKLSWAGESCPVGKWGPVSS
jgi:hypothetical protein